MIDNGKETAIHLNPKYKARAHTVLGYYYLTQQPIVLGYC